MMNATVSISKSGMVTISPEKPGQRINELARNSLISLYKKHGAILFSGFPFELTAFRDLTHRFCTHAVENLSGGREIVDSENNIQTVDPGDGPFPLHPELSREPWKPDVCFFACEKAPISGGQTIFCDGVELVRTLPRRVRSALFKRKLKYTVPATRAEVKFWLKTESPGPDDLLNPPEDCPFEFVEIGGVIHRSYVAPVFHKPMFHNGLAFGNFLLFSRYLHNDRSFPCFEDGSFVPDELVDPIQKAGERLAVRRAWRLGDILMLDNTRYLHARTAINNLSARRILTYFGYLNFACTKQDPTPNARWRNPGWLDDISEKIVT
jgi:alpha-ketoglutarate-dependent taurine dioxygenase